MNNTLLNNELEQLYQSQLDTFALAKQNFANLRNTDCRTLEFDGFNLTIQHNPDRLISTAAKTDARTLRERKCFLCPAHRPEEQKGLPYGDRYDICINPYPIFERHFTVPDRSHCDQRIAGRLPDMLGLAKNFEEYAVFYNGPLCGASVPDHFHFQMAPRRGMPMEQEVNQENKIAVIAEGLGFSITTIENYLRKILILKSDCPEILLREFQATVEVLGNVQPSELEPMFNLFAWYEHGVWTLILFPRKQLRPWQFFAEGKDQLLFSPGCVDMAGLIIAPRKEDFERYSKELLTDLFCQVTLEDQAWSKVKYDLSRR